MTLFRCDRCWVTSTAPMIQLATSGNFQLPKSWHLCSGCYTLFLAFLKFDGSL